MSNVARWWALLLALGCFAPAWMSLASAARAQHTGGSAGSSGFGSSGGGSSSSGSSYESSGSGGSSYSSGSSGSSQHPSEPINASTYSVPSAALGTPLFAPSAPTATPIEKAARAGEKGGLFLASGCVAYLLFVGLFGALGVFVTRGKAGGTAVVRAGAWEVRRLSIAFDWTARAQIQQALDEVTRTTAIGDDAGRRVLLGRVAAMMSQSLGAARYAMFQSFGVGAELAEQRFLDAASDLRARFKKETRGLRALDPAPELRARADEGQGLVVVSIVGAFDRRLPQLPRGVDPTSLSSALRGLAGAPRVVAIEVVWSPAEELDRMSSAELELFYPELLRVDATSTDVGRNCCRYCSSVYPAELGKCVACGAPVA
jgi:uncharacterized membrane protein